MSATLGSFRRGGGGGSGAGSGTNSTTLGVPRSNSSKNLLGMA